MTTDTPAAAPITAEREAFDAWWTKNYNIQSTLARAAAWMAWSTRAAPCLICAANHYCPQHNPAPVAAQPAVSGVDALWVAEAMQLALDCEGLYGPRYGKARDALRTHLSTALGGKING